MLVIVEANNLYLTFPYKYVRMDGWLSSDSRTSSNEQVRDRFKLHVRITRLHEVRVRIEVIVEIARN